MPVQATNLPLRPDAYFTFLPAPDADPGVASLGQTGALIYTHDSGPIGVPVQYASYQQWVQVNGDTETSAARAVRDAFRGEDVLDEAGATRVTGAGAIIGVRAAATTGQGAAAFATLTLKNAANQDALRLTARWPGTRADQISASVKSASSTTQALTIYDGTVQVESYEFAASELGDLAELITDTSAILGTAELVTPSSAGPLALVATASLSGGADGLTLTLADVSAALSLLEPEPFSTLCFDGLVDATAQTAVRAWIASRNGRGKRTYLFEGGDFGESATQALTTVAAIEDPNVSRVGLSVAVDELGNRLNGAQIAPRRMGVALACGDTRSATYTRFGGWTLESAATDFQVDQAIRAGLECFAADYDTVAPVHLVKALTTWTTTSDDLRPYMVFRNPKNVRTMHLLELDFREVTRKFFIGRRSTRPDDVGELTLKYQDLLKAREERRALKPGSTVAPIPSDDDTDEAARFKYGITFQRVPEQVFGEFDFR